MTKINFNRVKQLVESGRLELISIIAPVRTASTITSRCFANHGQVDATCSQPFHLAYNYPYKPPDDRENDGYGLLLATYESVATTSIGQPVRIVVKEMARNFSTGGHIERWNQLAGKHLITVRNPILSVESLIRMNLKFFFNEMQEGYKELAHTYAARNGLEFTPAYRDDFLNCYAKSLGFETDDDSGQHYLALVRYTTQKDDYRLLGDLLKEFEPYEDLNTRLPEMIRHYVRSVDDHIANAAGFDGLDAFAKSRGYQDWHHQQQHVLDCGNFKPVQTLLDEVFSMSITGWFNLTKILPLLDDYAVIETSVMRTTPELVFAPACHYLDIDDSGINAMLMLVDDRTATTSEHMEAHYIRAQERTHNSLMLEPPTEPPAPISRFPEHVQKHILDVALPAYLTLLQSDRVFVPDDEKEISELLATTIGKDRRSLMETDPVLAQSIICSAKKVSRQSKAKMTGKLLREGCDYFDPILQRISALTLD